MSSYEVLQLRNIVNIKCDEVERLSIAKYKLETMISDFRCIIRDFDKYYWLGESRKKVELLEKETKEIYQKKISSIENKIEFMNNELKKIECQIDVFNGNIHRLLLEEGR